MSGDGSGPYGSLRCDCCDLPVDSCGRAVEQPNRQPTPVWYGRCQHWTERWDVLVGDGVPLCPIDGAPGFHADETWWPSVDKYEADGHPGYRAHVEGNRIGGRFHAPSSRDRSSSAVQP